MRFVVATHGHCFDGLASAVMFTRLMGELGSGGPFEYRACGYGIGQTRPDPAVLSGDDNAVLDYRFSASERLTWYFDHHRTAFQNGDDRAVFDGRLSSGRYFYDPGYSSCTKFIADVAAKEFGLRDASLDDLVRWADVIDSAKFESPHHAIRRDDPVMRMVSVVEHYGDDAFLTRFVPALLQRPLSEVARSPAIEERYRPLGEKHERFIERVRVRSERRGRVVFVDLTESVLDSVGKFVTYALYPDSVYSVVIGLLKNGTKISVGYNPWSGQPLDVDISAICARYGGGGHPVVGGISFDVAQLEHARGVARSIAAELDGDAQRAS
jgi:hypothetical protein